MKNIPFKIALIILFATIFMSIGYAAINSITMDITGLAQAQPQNGVFISDVQYQLSIDAFTITNVENKFTNKGIDITAVRIKVYTT